MNLCGIKTWLAVYLLLWLLFLVLKLGSRNYLQIQGGFAKDSGEWLQMWEKVLATWEGFHILWLTVSLSREGCLWCTVSIRDYRDNNCWKMPFLLGRILLDLKYLLTTKTILKIYSLFRNKIDTWRGGHL